MQGDGRCCGRLQYTWSSCCQVTLFSLLVPKGSRFLTFGLSKVRFSHFWSFKGRSFLTVGPQKVKFIDQVEVKMYWTSLISMSRLGAWRTSDIESYQSAYVSLVLHRFSPFFFRSARTSQNTFVRPSVPRQKSKSPLEPYKSSQDHARPLIRHNAVKRTV